MAGLPKRDYGPRGNRMHADMRRAVHDLEGQVDGATVYAPADAASWASPPPTTVREALDRLAAAIHTLHPGSEP